MSTADFAVLAAIPLMPIGDLIVIAFTSPVFSVFLDRIVNQRSLTLLSISLCFLIAVGDTLVARPPFIFGDDDQGSNTSSVNNTTTSANEKRGPYYFYGVGLCFYCAAAVAVANVLIAKCNALSVSTSFLMLVSGFFSLLLSLVLTPLLSNRVLKDPLSLSLEAGWYPQ